MKNGKLLNSILAGGALLGATMLAPKADAAQLNNKQASQLVVKADSKLSQKEEAVAGYLYHFVSAAVSRKDLSTASLELKLIAKALASRQVYLNEKSDVYELLKSEFGILNQNKLLDTNKITAEAADYAKTLLDDPKSLIYGVRKGAPILFASADSETPVKDGYIVKKRSYTKDFVFYSMDKVVDADKVNFLARVLYSETSTVATEEEFKLVCKVIMNRIGDADFGRTSDAYDVVKVKNAFSCINDSKNSNWSKFTPTLNKTAARAVEYANAMLAGETQYLDLPDTDAVYYHDKSISCPKSWTNKYWKPELVKVTAHFKFYKVVPNSN